MRGKDLVKQRLRTPNKSLDRTMSQRIVHIPKLIEPVEELGSWWDIKDDLESSEDENDKDNIMTKMCQSFFKLLGDDNPFKKEIEEYRQEQQILESKDHPPDL
jgi:hypothetical protein